ncbi:response regulator transcription factor [Plantibacter sp. M259]|uniref:response regulator n=1 Tax=Plantibacter sp. M259 TaxID=2583822 RepID=UPI001F1122AB|nr:response regulator transcription factor [Plantibacter sp. M259]
MPLVSALRVAIVEDQELYLAMLAAVVNAHPTTTVVAAASGATEARRKILPGTADVVIMDVELADGNGVALGVSLRRRDPELGILLLSSHDVMDLVLSLPEDISAGWSYLSKLSSMNAETLIRVLWGTAQGNTILDPALVDKSTARLGSGLAGLTARQFEVLKLVSQGYSNQATADRLALSVRSVEGHLKGIYDVLKISNDGNVNPRVSATIAFLRETSRTI